MGAGGRGYLVKDHAEEILDGIQRVLQLAERSWAPDLLGKLCAQRGAIIDSVLPVRGCQNGVVPVALK